MCGGMAHHPVDIVWQNKIREAIKRHGMDDLSNKESDSFDYSAKGANESEVKRN